MLHITGKINQVMEKHGTHQLILLILLQVVVKLKKRKPNH
jgi:hypothetical protein